MYVNTRPPASNSFPAEFVFDPPSRMSWISAIVPHAAPSTSTTIIAILIDRTFAERASMRPGSVTSMATRIDRR